MGSKTEWRAQIRARGQQRPKLEAEERPWVGEPEECVVCDAPTRYWLHPENVPLCNHPKATCLETYLGDPGAYFDPRGLHVKKIKVLEVKVTYVHKKSTIKVEK